VVITLEYAAHISRYLRTQADEVTLATSSGAYAIRADLRDLHGFGTSMPRLGSFVRNRLIELADSCVLYGPVAREALIRKGYDPEKPFVAPNALDQVQIASAAEYWTSGARLKEFRRQQGIEDRPLVLYMSRLEREKRPDMLLEALRWVRAQEQDLELVFIGGGSLQDELRTAAARSNVASAVRFLGPVYDEMRVAPWALSCLCMVQPEKLGLSILHAFGYGVPVITSGDRSSQGPEAEVLVDGVNGLFYRRGDVQDLATKILALVGDDDLARSLPRGAMEVVSGPDGRNTRAMVAGLLEAIEASATRSRERGQ
jgi:glycosyltransferase involved in cell wall biosynthesis